MKKRLSNQFLSNYLIVFLLTILATVLTFSMISFASGWISKSLVKNKFTAASIMREDYKQINASEVGEIIVDLLKVLGCGVEIKTKHNKEFNTFDINNLRWNKVIICTDADVDGFQIRTLILAMLYRLAPSLINEGKVFIAESPLFEITAKDKTYFAYSDKEKNDIVAKLKVKYTVQRSKGLGENEPEMMWLTTMNPETRKLIKVMPDDVENTEKMFDVLLGDNLPGRKIFIEENGHKYLDMIDVS